jgi:hypothetical protein
MENVSEIKRRGRPRVITGDNVSAVMMALGKPDATARTQQNKLYQLYAMKVLGLGQGQKRDPYPFLWKTDHATEDTRVRWTLLTELGRFTHAETMRAVARKVCELKLSTRKTVVIIRRFRLGRNSAGDTLKLANELIGLVNDYIERHPAMPHAEMLAAFETARNAVEESQ